MKDLAQRFAAHWRERAYVAGDHRVLLALSGGIDSMVLAELLRQAKIPFAAAHCNFGLRGAASADDAAFVHDWCLNRSVECHIEVFATAELAEQRGESIQVVARNLRYEWFERLRKQLDFAAVLTAHHADDVAETVLINLCRGSGIAGLHGIPERNGAIIRPLLFATRAEISAYAAEQGITWREDASNAKNDYLRNALRHEVMPRLEALLPGASRRMAETAGRIAEAEIYYRQGIRKRVSRLVEQRGQDQYVPVRLLEKMEGSGTIAYELFSQYGFTTDQLPQILRLMRSESGRSVSSKSHRIIRHRDFLVLTALAAEEADLLLVSEVPSRLRTPAGSFEFSWGYPAGELSADANIAMLDADALTLPLVLRTRREGDYFYPLGMGGKKKKLKRFLIDLKLPLHQKEQVRILECDKRIVWIAGLRIDERFKLRPSTKNVLKVVFRPAQPESGALL